MGSSFCKLDQPVEKARYVEQYFKQNKNNTTVLRKRVYIKRQDVCVTKNNVSFKAVEDATWINSLVLEIIQNSFSWNFRGKIRFYHPNFSTNMSLHVASGGSVNYMAV